MKLSNGWQQIALEDGCKDFRRAYKDSDSNTILCLRLWETQYSWRIEVSCKPLNKGIACNHPIVFWHLPTSSDEESMMNEAEEFAREDFSRLHTLCQLIVMELDLD